MKPYSIGAPLESAASEDGMYAESSEKIVYKEPAPTEFFSADEASRPGTPVAWLSETGESKETSDWQGIQ